MRSIKLRVIYLMLVISFLVIAGFLWLDFIGFIDIKKFKEEYFPAKHELALDSKEEEPGLLKKEELQKSQEALEIEREKLALLKIKLDEREKKLKESEEKLTEKEKGLDLQKVKFKDDRKKYESYTKNISDLANKINNMPPNGAVKIMDNWDDLLVIDVLRRMDAMALEEGKASITSYLLFLIQQKDPSRAGIIMRKMAESGPEEL